MDVDGVKEYIDYLLQHFNEGKGDDTWVFFISFVGISSAFTL